MIMNSELSRRVAQISEILRTQLSRKEMDDLIIQVNKAKDFNSLPMKNQRQIIKAEQK